jgi:hypothetical protein
MARRLLLLLAATALLLAACDPDTAPEPPSPDGTVAPTATDTETPAPGVPDPLIPYSPEPTPFRERTTAFARETLTLPTADGGQLWITLDSTAIQREFVDGMRWVSAWVTVENPGDRAWTGRPGEFARMTDELGGTFAAIADIGPADLHPRPQKYDASNRDLQREVTIEAGDSIQGVIVFRPDGGNRRVNISVSMDGGQTWGEWQTAIGPF